MIPQLDRPGSLPIRYLTRGRMGRLSDQIEQDPSQGGTNVQRATTIRRREYPGEGDGDDYYRRPHQGQRPLTGGYPNGGRRPPDRGGYPVEDPLMEEEDPLDHQRTRTTRPSRTSWGCEANNCANPQVTLGHHSTRKYI